jgi:hypothetical protein
VIIGRVGRQSGFDVAVAEILGEATQRVRAQKFIALVSLIDCFVVQLSQVFMFSCCEFFMLVPFVDGGFGGPDGFGDG